MEMVVYQLSGILMFIGVYFTIRYRPYCTLKSPKRETVMMLHRKKLLNEEISKEENKKLDKYLKQTLKYSVGDFILLLSIIAHIGIFVHNEWYHLTPLYYLSMISMLTIVVMRNSYLPYCYEPLLSMLLWNHKNAHLERLNVYYKHKNNITLNESVLQSCESEAYIYKSEGWALSFFKFYRFSINFGVLLHLSLDIWFGLLWLLKVYIEKNVL